MLLTPVLVHGGRDQRILASYWASSLAKMASSGFGERSVSKEKVELGVPLRSSGCLVSVAVYRGKHCQPAGPACRVGAGFPTPPSGVDPSHLGLFVSKGCILGSW